MKRRWIFAAPVAVVLASLAARDAYELGGSTVVSLADPLRFYRGEVSALEALKIIDSSKSALADEPLSSSIVRDLALANLVIGDTRGLTQLGLADVVSRRDATTQLALLEYAQSQNAYAAAAQHLDRLVTVHPDIGRRILDGDMGFFTGHPEASNALAEYAGRPWFAGFLMRSITQSDAPQDLVQLAMRSKVQLSPGDVKGLSYVLANLVDRGNSEAAIGLAAKLSRVDRSVLEDFRFSTVNVQQHLAPLGWKIANDNRVSSKWSAADGLAVRLGVGNSVIILERRTHFAPGIYELEQQVGDLGGNASIAVVWNLECMSASPTFSAWKQPVPVNSAVVHYRSRVRIPQNCRMQRWRLSAGAIDGQTGASFRLVSVSLRRVGIAHS